MGLSVEYTGGAFTGQQDGGRADSGASAGEQAVPDAARSGRQMDPGQVFHPDSDSRIEPAPHPGLDPDRGPGPGSAQIPYPPLVLAPT